MPNVFVVLGGRDTRKSTTIRALTGARIRREWQVATQNGNIKIFVQISALQESKIEPQRFIQETARYPNILVCLWISRGNRQPNGLEYIQAFIKKRWPISQIVVLGVRSLPYDLPGSLPNPYFIDNSKEIPANQIAHQIRRRWRWL